MRLVTMELAGLLPTSRIRDLIITETVDDTIIYDKSRHVIHHLNPMAARIWKLANGTASISDIAIQVGVATEVVILAAQKLAEAELLHFPVASRERSSRRTLLGRAAVAGTVLPIVVSLSAPLAAMADSTTCGDPTSYIAHTVDIANVNWNANAYMSGFCPNSFYSATKYRRLGDDVYPEGADFTTDASGNAIVFLWERRVGSGTEVRMETSSPYTDTGYVAMP